MKNRTLIITFAVSATALVATTVAYFSLSSGSGPKRGDTVKPTKTTSQTTLTPQQSLPTAPASTTETPVAVPASMLTTETAKRYANATYGFSFLMPKEYWYEERDFGPSSDGIASPLFSVSVEHPTLRPEPLSRTDGSTWTPKYGVLMTVDAYASAHGMRAPGGMDYSAAVPTTVGGLSATKFDDRGYAVAGKRYSYFIGLDPSDSAGTAEMKRAFEDVVRTLRFE